MHMEARVIRAGVLFVSLWQGLAYPTESTFKEGDVHHYVLDSSGDHPVGSSGSIDSSGDHHLSAGHDETLQSYIFYGSVALAFGAVLHALMMLFEAWLRRGCKCNLTTYTPPYTVALLIVGLLLMWTLDYVSNFGDNGHNQAFLSMIGDINPHELALAFLPPLLFNSAQNLHFREFMREAPLSMLLAFPGVMLSAYLTKEYATYALNIAEENYAWMFGFIVSATDPVAVVTLLQDLGREESITICVEGESLFNDGSAYVLFMFYLMQETAPDEDAYVYAAACIGYAVVIGFVAGLVTSFALFIIKKQANDELAHTAFSVSSSFIIFRIAALMNASEVISVVIAGIIVGNLKWEKVFSREYERARFYTPLDDAERRSLLRPTTPDNITDVTHDEPLNEGEPASQHDSPNEVGEGTRNESVNESKQDDQVFKAVWSYMEFTANSVLFVLTGMILYYEVFVAEKRTRPGLFEDIVWCWLALAGIRAIVILVCMLASQSCNWALDRCKVRTNKSEEVKRAYLREKFFVLWWGALRGAVGVVLIIILMDERDLNKRFVNEIVAVVCGIIALTTLVNAWSMKFLLAHFWPGDEDQDHLACYRCAPTKTRNNGERNEDDLVAGRESDHADSDTQEDSEENSSTVNRQDSLRSDHTKLSFYY